MRFVLTILLAWNTCLAQDIPKAANVIKVSGTSYDKVMNSLLDSNYQILKSDKEYGTILTSWKPVCNDCIPQVQFYIRIKDSVATVTGKWRTIGDLSFESLMTGLDSKKAEENATVFDIANNKAKAFRVTFAKMKTIAESFGGNAVFLKQ